MDVKIIIPQNISRQIQRKLFPPNSIHEQFGFILAGTSKYADGCNLLCRKFFHADESCLVNQSGVSVAPDPRFVQFVYTGARDSQSAIITLHTHPFCGYGVRFSGIDDQSEMESFPREVEILGDGPHASIVLGRKSIDARWYDSVTRQIKPVNLIKVIGESGIEILKPTSSNHIYHEIAAREVHHRQVLAFGESGQKLIQQTKVAIAGCGGIGSVIFVLLVRLGVKDFILIDHDVVEMSNLNRLAGSRFADVENGSLKVEMLAEYGLQINPEIRVAIIADSVFSEKAVFALKSCDYIFGGFDAESPREMLNSFSVKHLTPFIDCGTGIQSGKEHSIEHAGGQVRTVIPGCGCLRCINGIDMDVAHMEQLPEKQRQFVIQRGYIAGEDEHAPAVAPLNGVIANLAVTEFMGHVTGCKPLSRYVFYDFMKSVTIPVDFPKNPDCFSCSEDSLLASGDKGVLLPHYLVSEQLTQV